MSGFDFVVTVVVAAQQLLNSLAWLWVPLVFLLWLGYIARGIVRAIDETIMRRRAEVDQKTDQIHQELKRLHNTMERAADSLDRLVNILEPSPGD